MADMDFSAVLTSREFTDTISILSQTNTIGTSGVSAPSTTSTNIMTAVVIPGRSNLRRLDDGSRIQANIDVYVRGTALTTGHRIDDASERVADVVTWHGRNFVVAAVEDFSAFGPGFVKASCDLINLNPSA